jgi:hypothetical protein
MFSIYVVAHENVILYFFHCFFILQKKLVVVSPIGNKSPLRTFLNNVFPKIIVNLLLFFIMFNYLVCHLPQNLLVLC